MSRKENIIMAFELNAALYRLVDKYVTAKRIGMLRRDDRKVCKAHPEWTPLTSNEYRSIDSGDRWGYTIYKNMSPEGSELRYFIPEIPYRMKILPALNFLNHTNNGVSTDCLFSDKNYHDTFMRGIRFPKTVIRRIGGVFYDEEFNRLTSEQAEALLQRYDVLVFKQTVETGHGTGIRRIEREEYGGVYMTYADDYIVQELVRQHPSLSYFNPSSVNVLRITSLFWRGDVYILGSILRVGAPGAFCDHENRGGDNYLSIPVADDGTILPRPVDVESYRVFTDCRGIPVRGVVPGFEKMKELIIREHERYPHFGLIGWDVTADENGDPVFMEFNTKYPGLTGTQCALGPVLAQKSVRGVPLFDELREAFF